MRVFCLALALALWVPSVTNANRFEVTAPPGGAQVLHHPAIVNLYLAADWDALTASTAQGLSREALDAWTMALTNSRYFEDIAQYGVAQPLFAGSFELAPGCSIANPATPDAVKSALRCQIASPPVAALRAQLAAAGHDAAFVVFVSPAVTYQDKDGLSCPDAAPAYHWNDNETVYTAIGMNAQCRAITLGIAHELTELFTDPHTMNGFVHREGLLGLDQGALQTGEVADVCQEGAMRQASAFVPFLLNMPAGFYWSNAAQRCVPVWPVSHPAVASTTYTVGAARTITLQGQGFGDVAAALGRRAATPTGRQAFPLHTLSPYVQIAPMTSGGTTTPTAGNVFSPGDEPLDILQWTPTMVQLQYQPQSAGTCDQYSVTLYHPDDGSAVTGLAQPGAPDAMSFAGFPGAKFPLLVNPQIPFVVHGRLLLFAGGYPLVNAVPVELTITDQGRGTSTKSRRWANGGKLEIPITVYQTTGPITVRAVLPCRTSVPPITLQIPIAPRPTHTVPPRPSPLPSWLPH